MIIVVLLYAMSGRYLIEYNGGLLYVFVTKYVRRGQGARRTEKGEKFTTSRYTHTFY